VQSSKVIVVDDDPGVLKAVQRLLRQHNYEPILFSSAEELEQHADISNALCIILDINLDRGSGIDLRHQLKAKGASVPVIFITGNATPSVREAALRSGCRRISDQAVLSPRTDRAAQESVGRVKLSARVPGPCTLYFGTMHHRTPFAKLISEFGLSGTSPPINTGTQPPVAPVSPRTGATPFHVSALVLAVSLAHRSLIWVNVRDPLGTHAMFSRAGSGSITFQSQARRGVNHESDEAYFDQVSDCCRDGSQRPFGTCRCHPQSGTSQGGRVLHVRGLSRGLRCPGRCRAQAASCGARCGSS
jgi:CheY-like chemotaxis protein